ncbi:MAG: hypothetical protein VXZ35_14430, partial [Pseudomonadota bacterium]|nr:hypothetical protein [Pseudomonadota bacterium]
PKTPKPHTSEIYSYFNKKWSEFNSFFPFSLNFEPSFSNRQDYKYKLKYYAAQLYATCRSTQKDERAPRLADEEAGVPQHKVVEVILQIRPAESCPACAWAEQETSGQGRRKRTGDRPTAHLRNLRLA